ncbi:MAG: nodulation protein NfeD [Gammaproteobacteria bacterium]|nr:MAG: nodulation protein NfeD [Gammaproteobacteria bacterium]
MQWRRLTRPTGRLAAGSLVLLALAWLIAAAEAGGTLLRLELRGAIGPATSDYVLSGLAEAEARGAELLLIEMDTPGGLDSAMREIIKAILASPVPVVTWVAPGGSRAASAGTYILYASHVAAMAPGTNLGAATPVQIGGAPGLPGEPAPDRKPAGDGPGEATEPAQDGAAAAAQPGTAMERKAINDAVAYIRSLAELRGRNADWAERAVREAASLSAREALAENVIDLLAGSLPELLTQLDGRTVTVAGEPRQLETSDLQVVEFEADWRTRLLATITDPNIAYFLLLVGVYGLIFEGYNPGAIVPGVVGAICLLLALFAFQVLPVNYAGLALMLLGIILMIAEAFAPSFGALGLGGIVAFVFGSVILFDADVPGFEVARSLITGVAAVAALLLMGLMLMLARIRRRPVVTGPEEMLGGIARALEDFEGRGDVFIHGERWQAECPVPVRKGQKLRVTRVDGLTLQVEPLAETESETELGEEQCR